MTPWLLVSLLDICNCWCAYKFCALGADVSHPGPGVATRPSMTGFVASVSPGAAFAVSYAGVQQPRVEMIQDLTTMVMVCVSQYLNCCEVSIIHNGFFVACYWSMGIISKCKHAWSEVVASQKYLFLQGWGEWGRVWTGCPAGNSPDQRWDQCTCGYSNGLLTAT